MTAVNLSWGEELEGRLTDPLTRELLAKAGVFVAVVDETSRVLYMSVGGARVLGGTPESYVGRNWLEDLVGSASREACRVHLAAVLAGVEGTPCVCDVLSRGNIHRTLDLRCQRIGSDSETGAVVLMVGTDVTSSRTLTKQLGDFKRALDEASILAITNQRGEITYVNDKFCEISGYEEGELLGEDHRLLNSKYHPKSFIRGLWRTISHGDVWHGDIRNRAKDGSIYWVSTTIVPFLDERGKPYQYVAVRNDITERRRAEQALEEMVTQLAELTELERQRAEQLQEARDQLMEANRRILEEQRNVIQAEKLSSIGLLASGVAHEINNPLAGVMGCLKAIEANTLAPERREQYVTAMKDGLERIQSIVGSLLNYARRNTPRHQALDAAELVAETSHLLQAILRKALVDVECNVESGALPIYGDRSQIMQALVNVVMNALYVSPPGATISVVGASDNGWTWLDISDQGPGIGEEDVGRICDPFFSTKPEGEGTGLGLSVTLSIVEAHGGRLEFNSKLGEGTTVRFHLPSQPRGGDNAPSPTG